MSRNIKETFPPKVYVQGIKGIDAACSMQDAMLMQYVEGVKRSSNTVIRLEYVYFIDVVWEVLFTRPTLDKCLPM